MPCPDKKRQHQHIYRDQQSHMADTMAARRPHAFDSQALCHATKHSMHCIMSQHMLKNLADCCAGAAVMLCVTQVMGREHRNIDVPALISQLKKSHRWHVETA